MQIALQLFLIAAFAGVGYCTFGIDTAMQNGLDFTSKVLKTPKNLLDKTSDLLRPLVPGTTKEPVEKVPDMVRKAGYHAESHYVTTSDGYILNMHRINRGQDKYQNYKVVFLQHCLMGASTDWVIAGPGKGLAYIMADEGYDVWMGNARGNVYSRNHTTLNPNKHSKFWQFSWHEIGMTDLPNMIDYVIQNTGVDEIYYAGHGQGTTAFYVMTSSKPEYNEKIKVHVSLSPTAFMNHMTSPLLRVVGFWEKSLEVLLNLIGKDEFLPNNGFMSMLSSAICSEKVGTILCSNALFAVCGFSPKQMNTSLVPDLVNHYPAGGSTRQILHYLQEMNSGRFCQYNEGLIGNTKKYGSMIPPDYNLDEITTPVYLIYSQNDWLSGIKDVERLANALGNLKEKILVSDPQWNHLDFVFGLDAPRLVYRKVIEIFKKY